MYVGMVSHVVSNFQLSSCAQTASLDSTDSITAHKALLAASWSWKPAALHSSAGCVCETTTSRKKNVVPEYRLVSLRMTHRPDQRAPQRHNSSTVVWFRLQRRRSKSCKTINASGPLGLESSQDAGMF